MTLSYAEIIAMDIWQKLKPYCDKIKIAGSIRRRKDEVKDIELVLIIKRTMHEEKNLFGEVIRQYEILDPGYEEQLKTIGTIEKGKVTGKYMKLMATHDIHGIEHKIAVDIFMPAAFDYYRMLAIRTGSADYAFKKIASQWVKKGWCGVDGKTGLYLQKDCDEIISNGKRTGWKLKNENAEHKRPPVWESETDFFKWLDIQYLAPEHRNL